MRLVAIVAAAVFVIDQLTKWWVVHVMELARVGAIDVFPPYLNFRMAWNTGINFVLFVLVWMRRDPPGRTGLVFAGLLIGGALGNVVDRLLYGAVADFLNMSCCGIDNPYAFNAADISVFFGAIGLALFSSGKNAS